MANVDIAFMFTMKHEDFTLEGKVVTDNNGGQVRFGVNSVDYPDAITDGFYSMPRIEAWAYAMKVFITAYWQPMSGDKINSQAIANKIVDLGFNMGIHEMIKITQRAVNYVLGSLVLTVDGVLGPKSLAQINGLDSTKLLLAIIEYAKQFYQDLARRKTEDAKYLKGWLARVDA